MTKADLTIDDYEREIDCLNTELFEVKSLLENKTWRPTDSAPVGEDVLAYWKTGHMAVASYTGITDYKLKHPVWEIECEAQRHAPIYWMPIPEPPGD